MRIHRHAHPVESSAEGLVMVPHRCRACGWGGELAVKGEVTRFGMPRFPGDEEATRERIRELATRMVAPDARESAELSKCPRCGARDDVALGALNGRATWRAVAVVLAMAALSFCAGPMPWWAYACALVVAGGAAILTVVSRLHRADRAVLFVKEEPSEPG